MAMTEQQNEEGSAKSGQKASSVGWFGWLGRITATISLYNIVNAHVERLPVSIVFRSVLNYYRQVFYPVADCLKHIVALVHINIPFSNDSIILYLLLGASFARYELRDLWEEPGAGMPSNRILRHAMPFLFTLIYPVFFYFGTYTSIVSSGESRDSSRRRFKEMIIGTLLELLRIGCIFLLFLLFNAANPSISWQAGH